MYTSSKLGHLMATSDKTIQPEQSSDKDIQHRRDECIRRGLLIWSSLRLAVSVLWTGVLVIMTWQSLAHYWYQRETAEFATAPNILTFGLVAIVLQLVEFGMIVTFICAGVKKRASLYRAYYRYCILTLIIYIIAVTLCFVLDFENGHYFGEIYLTYHICDFPVIVNDALIFLIAAILDICLEILLIHLIKRLIKKYSYVEDMKNCENV